MDFRKIVGPLRIDGPAAGGNATNYPQAARSGGRNTKGVQYMVKVVAASSNAKVGVILDHGPDGDVFILHSTPVPTAAVPATLPGLLVGESAAGMIGEWLRPVLTCISADASVCWAMVELYEMRKPF